MGKSPNKPAKSDKGAKPTQTRIVSFDDARAAAKPSTRGTRTSAAKPRKKGKNIKLATGEARSGALNLRTIEEVEEEERLLKAQKAEEAKQAKLEKKEAKKKAKAKAKAAKAFEKSYDPSKASNAGSASFDNAPRAALYKGEMGSSHRKSSKLQKNGEGASFKDMRSLKGAFAASKSRFDGFSQRARRAIIAACVVLGMGVCLYGPAQDYYLQMRETDRLQAEYIAVAERSNNLKTSIDTLSSEEGIEDKAHTDLGYVKKGEETATVKGITLPDQKEFSSTVPPGSVPAPDTWYSPFLDVIFGYSK